jgi:hypothetical protein
MGRAPTHRLKRVMSERERRIGENEAAWREVNELEPPDPPGMSAVFCECGIVGCTERVLMTAGEYTRVRSTSTTFVVAPGHVLGEAERVVEQSDRFLIVDKHGEAAAVAEDLDPRDSAPAL